MNALKKFCIEVSAGALLLVVAALSLCYIASPAHANEQRPLYASETHNFGSLVDAAGETGSIAVSGARLGDVCLASVAVDLVDMVLTCYVQAANTVEYRLQNESGSTVDLASTTVRIVLFKTPQF